MSETSNQAPASAQADQAASAAAVQRGQDTQAGANERDAGGRTRDGEQPATGPGTRMPDASGSYGTTTVPKTSNDGAGGDVSGEAGTGAGTLGGAREQIQMRQDGRWPDPTVSVSCPREVVAGTARGTPQPQAGKS